MPFEENKIQSDVNALKGWTNFVSTPNGLTTLILAALMAYTQFTGKTIATPETKGNPSAQPAEVKVDPAALKDLVDTLKQLKDEVKKSKVEPKTDFEDVAEPQKTFAQQLADLKAELDSLRGDHETLRAKVLSMAEPKVELPKAEPAPVEAIPAFAMPIAGSVCGPDGCYSRPALPLFGRFRR